MRLNYDLWDKSENLRRINRINHLEKFNKTNRKNIQKMLVFFSTMCVFWPQRLEII